MTLSYAVTLPFGVAGAALIAYCVLQLVRRVRDSVVGSWPLAERLDLELKEYGRFHLNLECPQLSFADFGLSVLSLEASVTDRSTGQQIPVRKVFVGAEVKGFSTRRRPLFSFEPEHAGSYELVVQGMPEREGLKKCNFVLTRPLGASIVLFILGIITGFATLILSIVLPAVMG